MATERLTPGALAGLRIGTVREQPKVINVLVYGESGVGKTTLAGSSDLVPEMHPVLVVDIEGGTMSLSHAYPDCHVIRVRSWDEMQDLYNKLHTGNHPYKTIIIDSLTEIQKFSMDGIMKDVVEKDPNRDPDIPSLREWGKNTEQIRRYVRAFRDLPVNVIFTALVKEDKDQRTGTTTKRPLLPGQLSVQIPAFLDIVTYYYMKSVRKEDGSVERKRLLLATATDNIVAKDRTGKLTQIIEYPTMRHIYEAVVGHVSILGTLAEDTTDNENQEKAS